MCHSREHDPTYRDQESIARSMTPIAGTMTVRSQSLLLRSWYLLWRPQSLLWRTHSLESMVPVTWVAVPAIGTVTKMSAYLYRERVLLHSLILQLLRDAGICTINHI